jgi:hypothetical protein
MGDLTNFVTKNTAQTISGLKTFSADITLSGTTSIKNTTNGVSYTMLYRDASGIHVGTSTQALLLAGSNARPKFNNNDIAMLSDIPTVGNGTITIIQGGITKGQFTTNQSGDTTVALDAGGGGIGNIDNLTITTNTDSEIQAVAVIDQNTGIAKTWTGTMAEYDAIVTKDPETEYIITDDIGGPATVIAELAEGLNGKADVSALNTKTAHVVTEFQEPTAANNYTWYRKYADGWVEQGGIATGTNGTITLSVEMAGSNYQIMANVKNTSITGSNAVFSLLTNDLTTTSFGFKKTYNYGSASGVAGEDYFWQVSGMAA